jgi:NAD(P)-dependent dehydrogenase (short-subunit alcohol dehydrogenase family)
MEAPRKLALVTGANSGFGYEATSQLLARGTDVVMACRNEAAAQQAAAKLAARHAGTPTAGAPSVLQLDLADFKSVAAFAAAFEERFGGRKLALLVLNAGVMQFDRALTPQGFEATVGVNHLGHAALFNLLLPHLKRSGTRVVSVSSNLHKNGVVAPGAPFDAGTGMQAYNNSKLLNALWALEVQRRFAATGVTANALDPGVGLFTNLGPKAAWVTLLRATIIPLLAPFMWLAGLYQTRAGGGGE